MSDFKQIDISGGFKVNLKQDSSMTVSITADDNLMKYIRTEIDRMAPIVNETGLKIE